MNKVFFYRTAQFLISFLFIIFEPYRINPRQSMVYTILWTSNPYINPVMRLWWASMTTSAKCAYLMALWLLSTWKGREGCISFLFKPENAVSDFQGAGDSPFSVRWLERGKWKNPLLIPLQDKFYKPVAQRAQAVIINYLFRSFHIWQTSRESDTGASCSTGRIPGPLSACQLLRECYNGPLNSLPHRFVYASRGHE